jgi:hypothetical protein
MRNFKFLLFFAALLLSFNLLAEAQSKAAVTAKARKTSQCLFPKSRKHAPDWVCTSVDGHLVIAAVGSSAKSDAGNEFMEQMATADARVHLAIKLKTSVWKKIETSEHAETEITKSDEALLSRITEQSLEGTKVLKRAYDSRGTLYVLIGFDKAGTERLRQSIAETYRQRKNK